jgi:predicted nucleotidyltransferase
MEIDAIINELVESLKPADPLKIVLFGSYANGTAREDSDIDLMVILNNDEVAKTFSERLQKKVYIRKLLQETNKKIAIDLQVFSRAEFKTVQSLGNSFINEIEDTGRILYESAG